MAGRIATVAPIALLFKHGSTAVAAQVMPTAAIENIKAAVAPKLQSSVDDLVLTYEGTVLEDGKKVEEYKIKSGATVEVTITRKLGATLSKAWDRTVEWAPTVAFYAAVPVVLYIATTRRGAGWRDVWANVRMPFYD